MPYLCCEPQERLLLYPLAVDNVVQYCIYFVKLPDFYHENLVRQHHAIEGINQNGDSHDYFERNPDLGGFPYQNKRKRSEYKQGEYDNPHRLIIPGISSFLFYTAIWAKIGTYRKRSAALVTHGNCRHLRWFVYIFIHHHTCFFHKTVHIWRFKGPYLFCNNAANVWK